MTKSSDKSQLTESLSEYRAIQADALKDHGREWKAHQDDIALLREVFRKTAQRDWSAAERVWARFEWKDRIRNLFDIACALLCLAVIWRAFACW
jgi:hypothetical protein